MLISVPSSEWRTPSQAQPKNMFGHENRTWFQIRALTHDGVPRWIGILEDRDDFDAILWAIACGTLRYDRAMWDIFSATWMPQHGWGNVGWRPDFAEGLLYDFVTTVKITSGTSYTVPADCRGVSGKSGEFIDTIGAGGSGSAAVYDNISSNITQGGGGGAFSRVTSLALTQNGSVTIQIGVGGPTTTETNNGTNGTTGTATWFNGASLAASSVGADGGVSGKFSNGTSTLAVAAGGASASGIGTTKYSGGSSGGVISTARASIALGAGGAAGLNGAGTAGTNATASNTASAGGSGDAGSGGAGTAGVNASSGNSSAGGAGTEYSSHGSGGGSGGTRRTIASGTACTSGAGGAYGAGGGGAYHIIWGGISATSGKGGDGLIVMAYVPVYSRLRSNRPTRFFTQRF